MNITKPKYCQAYICFSSAHQNLSRKTLVLDEVVDQMKIIQDDLVDHQSRRNVTSDYNVLRKNLENVVYVPVTRYDSIFS